MSVFARDLPTGPPINLHPALALDLARLTALLADLLETSAAARAALTRHTATQPGYTTTQVIDDLRQHATDLTGALDHLERTR